MNVKLLASRSSLSSLGEGATLTVIPSANLTSRLKGKTFQYHDQVPRRKAKDIYEALASELREAADKAGVGFEAGVFGDTQRLVVDSSEGPFMHKAVL